jgi:hypothetical protein
MTRAEALRLTIERANAGVEEQLAAAECDLRDQGATEEHLEAELRCLRRIFEEARDHEIAATERWLLLGDAVVH